MRTSKHMLLVGLSPFAFAGAAPVGAQTAADTTGAPLQADPPPAAVAPEAGRAPSGSTVQPAVDPSAPASAGGGSGLEEIVVTAQRRAERLQDVPISVAAVTASAAARQGVSGTESLGIAVPALQFSRQTGNGGTPFIRGVGTTQAAAGAESPVAVYVDDVYIGSPSATLLQFNNIESTEVLKGPQGTLFGRNATGGVVHIHTKRPSHDFGLDATAGAGSYQTYYGTAYVTGGLSDTLAVNLAAAGQDQRKGFGRNVITGDDVHKGWNFGFRGQALWEPTDRATLLLSADYNRYNADFGQSVGLVPGTISAGGARYSGKYNTSDVPGDYSRGTIYGFSGKGEYDFGGVRLVSITAYRNNRQHYQLDGTSSTTPVPRTIFVQQQNYNRTFSQELQIVSPQDRKFKWILGGFYYRSAAGFDPIRFSGVAFTALAGANVIDDRQVLNSYAGFAEASYEFLPNTTLTAGVRYTQDRFKLTVDQRLGNGAIRPPAPFETSSKFPKATYRAILNHKFSRDLMVYASYSRGFKSGGYNLSAPTVVIGGVNRQAPVVSPEVLDAYEVGFKSELFDRQVRLNAAAFYYDYSNLQVTSIQNSSSITLNAASARVKGGDIDFNYVPNRRINLGGGFSFLDSKFKSFPNGPLFVPNPATCVGTPRTTGPLTGGNTTCTVDLAGNRTSRAPKFTMNLNATYTLPTSAGDFSANATLYHNSGFFWEPDNRFRQPRYNLLNATFSWVSPNKRLELKVYARNLLNEFYYSYLSEGTARDGYSPEMPRNFGGAVTVHF